MIFPAIQAMGQGCGEYKIKEAQDYYNKGNFNRVFAQLNPCLEINGFDNSQKALAYKLLSLTWLAMDSTMRASQAIEQMLVYNPSYEPENELLLPYRFISLVNGIRQNQARVVQVTSVSKKPEDLYKAPATALVISEDDIRQRGYTDLEALFSDLPGFDVSRSYGLTYSNIYQRGYRSDNTERTLFMINGIEENDFWSNIVYWSMQIPVSNVKRVEIVYGPSSTIYGANAFLGVINVITKGPKDLLSGTKKVAVLADLGYGSYNTRYADITAATRIGSAAFTITGRGYFSNLQDLSNYPEYDYNPSDYDLVNYAGQLRIASKGAYYANKYGLTDGTTHAPYYFLNGNALELTPAGVAAAQELDKKALQQTVGGNPIAYSNRLKAFYIRSSLTFNDVTLGFQLWNLEEGTLNSANDNSRAGAKNGNVWKPMQSLVYAVYNKEIIKDKLTLINTAQYRVDEINEQSRAVTLKNYSNGSLLYPFAQANPGINADTVPVLVRLGYNLARKTDPYWETQYFYQHSNQFRNELRLIASPVRQLDLVAGLETRSSMIQGDYKQITINYTLTTPIDTSAKDYGRSTLDNTAGGNSFEYFNLGAFFQGTYTINPQWQFTLGGRYDFARIRASGGYGKELNPRLALTYTPGRFAFKAIYSKAFQDASSRDRYAISSTRLKNNPTLRPDRIDNLELAVNYNSPNRYQLGVTAYYANCRNIVEEVSVPYLTGRTLQKQNTGTADIYGIQAVADYQYSERFQFYANYSYTNAFRGVTTTNAAGEFVKTQLQVGDIARHHVNAGANGKFFSNKLNINLRFNYVGNRPVGPGTSVPGNTKQPGGYFPAYTLVNAAITYRIFSFAQLQLILNNALNEVYADPGTRSANGTTQAYRTPQKTRNAMLRLMVSL
ncbi:TonB-dependent receptor plug domain-containing protein [Arsenicibacter rosenii]|uniref:TonB-dependent receptor n=1 Tax=Arsenicibacter rosenii TaxID=1750698 RepID=A0A1S2VQJ1_9BACT|nr:TonB-dependent receptor [Arsenicibacter rosenii]OIN60650.1 hypothetical protein BLX24_00600 [Arsenicibacter rosenii]